jgi:hypothetical protein
MKILFLLHKSNRLRNFDSLIRALAESGHTVVLGFRGKAKELVLSEEDAKEALPESLRHPLIDVSACGRLRSDGWSPFASTLRSMRDALRYFHPRYAEAHFLRNRAFKRLTSSAGRALVSLYGSRTGRLLAAPLGGLLSVVEKLIPSDRGIEADLMAHRPDALLVSPLIQFGTDYQVDYIKAAHALGIPAAFLPFSWDNLTNKGLMRIEPDRVFVWNEVQKREAVELHSIPAERVVVCGGWRFDEFFAMRPASGREEFLRGVGLDPARPVIAYLCSSESTSRNESLFIRKWLQALRDSGETALRGCGVLIRPYPGNWWKPEDFAGFDNVAIMPEEFYGSRRAASWGDQELFDCLHHSAAVVGLNTSAMIEAAVLGKPVHTILVDEFHGGQAGTLHFHYFLTVNGGLPRVAREFGEHVRQLAESLSRPGARDAKSDGFVKAFVRPWGLEEPVTPRLVREVEKLADLIKEPGRGPGLGRITAKAVLAFLNRAKPYFLDAGREAEPDKDDVPARLRAKPMVGTKA